MTDDIGDFVEKARKFMYDLAAEKGLNHPDVLAASQALDELLNDFQQSRARPKRKRKAKARGKHIRIEDRKSGYAVVIDHIDATYDINEFVTLRQATECAHNIADESYRPQLKVYYQGKLMTRSE